MSSPNINPLRMRSTEQPFLSLSPRLLEAREHLSHQEWSKARVAIDGLTEQFEKDIAESELALSYLNAGRVFMAEQHLGKIRCPYRHGDTSLEIAKSYLNKRQHKEAERIIFALQLPTSINEGICLLA